ncbi:MAG: DUF6562 domain-containing protein [Bacteroidales bacterium]
MKQIFLMSLLLGGAALTSCTSEIEPAIQPAEEQTVNISVGISSEMQARTFSETTDLEDLRLNLIISYDNVVVYSEQVDGWDGTSYDFDARLVTNVEYAVAAWADYGDDYYTITKEVGSAPKVDLVSDEIVGSDMNSDAFFAIDDVTFTDSEATLTMVLTRPFGLVLVNTNDYETPSIANAGITAYESVGNFTVPTSLSLLDGTVSDVKEIITTGYCSGSQLSFDYIFAEDETSINAFKFAYFEEDGSLLAEYDFNNIPVRRNYITSITGSILTESADLTVEINPEWEIPSNSATAGNE